MIYDCLLPKEQAFVFYANNYWFNHKYIMNTKPLFANIPAALLTLTVGGLSIGMTEFMMMGVLPDVAKTLSVSIPVAGHLISAYALGVVVGAPLMAVFASKYSPKKMLIGLMLLFAIFNALFALAPTYHLLLVARFFAGLPHGAFFGIGAVVASRLAVPGKEARSVSIMFAGLTLANIIGVPLGTYIGHNLSWRLSFFIVAFVALLAAGSIKKWMPIVPNASDKTFAESIKIFATPEPWLIIAICAIGTGGLFAWISYIAPLMTEVAVFQANTLTIIMIIAGLGMAAGNFLGGRLADKYSHLKTTGFLLVAMSISLVLVSLLSQYKVMAIILTFVTGALAFALASPMQMLMIKAAKGSEMLASSAMQASFNIGNAIGAFLGGLPIAAGFAYTSSEYVGAGLALGGLVFCLLLSRRITRQESVTVSTQSLVPSVKVQQVSYGKKEEEAFSATL